MKKNIEILPKYIGIGVAIVLVGMVIHDAHSPSQKDKRPHVEKNTRKPAANKITMEAAIEKLIAYNILGNSETTELGEAFLQHFMLYKRGLEGINAFPYVDSIIEMYFKAALRQSYDKHKPFPVDCIEAFLDNGCIIDDAHRCCMRVCRVHFLTEDDKLLSFIFRQLIKYAPQRINDPDGSGATPLMHAVYNASAKTCKLLLNAGADINARDEDGRTPLMYLGSKTKAESVRALIEAGADVNARDKNGRTPLMYAEHVSAEVRHILISSGAVINFAYQDDKEEEDDDEEEEEEDDDDDE